MGNQNSNPENQGGNLSMVVEMTQNSNGNNKLKELREVKIIENEHIRKNSLTHLIWCLFC